MVSPKALGCWRSSPVALRSLDVSHNNVGKSNIMSLTGLTALTALDLSFTRLPYPPPLAGLKWLSMNACPLASDWEVKFAEFLSTEGGGQPFGLLESVRFAGIEADKVRLLKFWFKLP